MAVEFQVTFDAGDPEALGGFWAAALGYVPDEPPQGFASWDAFLDAVGVRADERDVAWAIHDPEGRGPRLYFQKVPEGKTAKNRVHLDLRAAAGAKDYETRMAMLEAECERLVALGAERVRRFEKSLTSFGFIVMRDPEGNEFCLD
jgi:hypothetical protein